jgi:hypothetical protein
MQDETEVIIKIDITDWDKEYQKKEWQVSNHDDLIERAKEGIKPMELARNVIAARERGLTEPNIIGSNKRTFNIGGMFQINQLLTRLKRKNETKNGQEIITRALVCEVGTNGEDPEVVDSATDKGTQRAIQYLHSTGLGHIVGRLNIIGVNNGAKDVKRHGKILMAEIQEAIDLIVSKLE